MSTPAKYSQLPSSPPPYSSSSDEKKPALSRVDSVTLQQPSSSRPCSRTRVAIFLFSAGLSVAVLTATLYAVNMSLGNGLLGAGWLECPGKAAAREHLATAVNPSLSNDEEPQQLVKRGRDGHHGREAREESERETTSITTTSPAAESPKYSTSTYEDGDVSTFVYTTRPIVNPGGYTIGTLTGYVVESDATSTSTTSKPSSSPIVNPGGYTIGTLTGYVPLSTAESSSSSTTSPTTTTSSSSNEKRLRPAFYDPRSDSDDRQRKFKRSLFDALFDDVEELDLDLGEAEMEFVATPAEESTEGGEEATATVTETKTEKPTSAPESEPEYSFSVKKDGATETYVKTTRPILNPQGRTIGTLDGVYVKVTPTEAVATATAPPKIAYQHSELRKRVLLDDAAEDQQ
ncbi:hypothetical protein MNV49_006378 [Pseudohyphozyma bogoriensis]|nr:hypothetical protein MNV49_006378 [Pseudohyphozyma bogoriensis]